MVIATGESLTFKMGQTRHFGDQVRSASYRSQPPVPYTIGGLTNSVHGVLLNNTLFHGIG
jgi:hypothetical protein